MRVTVIETWSVFENAAGKGAIQYTFTNPIVERYPDGTYRRSEDPATHYVCGMVIKCPGCGSDTHLSFRNIPDPPNPQYASWEWNGDKENPTLTPSILHNKEKGGCGWHGYLTAGEFVSQ